MVIISERVTGRIDGEFVVFLIGMRVNRWWKVLQWLRVALAMPRMLRELHGKPELGFLGAEQGARIPQAGALGREPRVIV